MMSVKTLKSLLRNPKLSSPISQIHHYTSKPSSLHNPAIQFVLDAARESHSSKTRFDSPVRNEGQEILAQKHKGASSGIQVWHPWSEWGDFMKRLLRDGYFDEVGNPFEPARELGSKEANLIRTASLNFARDHYQLIRYLSRKDIMVVAGSGCPSTDRKVVNSGKRMRYHVGIDEGNVCSSCILRGECDRAYGKASEGEGGRTVDIMRLVLTYGLDPIVDSVENKPCLNKRVKESVRTLLKQMVEIRVVGHDEEQPKTATRVWSQESDVHQQRTQFAGPMKHGDWICPKCNFHNFARNIKCLRCDTFSEERLRKVAAEQENLPLKKGDWVCGKCNFLNFARNTKCLQCKEKPPKRHLNPGEWECDSCNYINFRRNMVCLKCDHKRPIASHSAGTVCQHANNSIRNHQTRARLGQDNKSGYEDYDSLEFVEDRDEDDDSVRSWDMRFPVAGGKSDFSHEMRRRELWRMEMAMNGKHEGHEKTFIESVDSDDGAEEEEDMAEWFGGVKK
ncbi:Ran BP2/NZF zinc finger-like superfamily protein [Striga hermonthica]|uniref:Ran BP2/NZF zinc finger-like superfamily protein n=1 Tax=Striga hermonthica TaxID=68872 RepID=A0A9N7RR72_STRHE|nr:Ran BP2/NZF zinc finger-like superfamily protein [Striga hermonthica]